MITSMSLQMPFNSRGVQDTLHFHGVPHDVRERVSKVLEQHGHLGTDEVMKHLGGLSGDDALSEHHLASVHEALRKHTIAEHEN